MSIKFSNDIINHITEFNKNWNRKIATPAILKQHQHFFFTVFNYENKSNINNSNT